MKRLVVCADDAGLAPSSDEAILRCHREGIVCCAAVVANGPTTESFLAAADMELGLHLNLTQGLALAGPAATLTDAKGRFLGPKREFWERARAGALDQDEVCHEAQAQWDWLARRGVEIAFINGHNHVHVFACDWLPETWVRLPTDPGLPEPIYAAAESMTGSWRRTDHFTGRAFSGEPTPRGFLECLEGCGDLTEFMVHPGSRPGTSFTNSPKRDREADALCSPDLKTELELRGWTLSCFSEL